MDSFEVVVQGELFRISERTQPGGTRGYDFAWLNGPAEGTYGFSIGQSFSWTDAEQEEVEAHPASGIPADVLVAEARRFIESFYEPGGIGETDFPNHTPANTGTTVVRTHTGRVIPITNRSPEEKAREYAEWMRERAKHRGTIPVVPAWGGREVISAATPISRELRKRLWAWNGVWQQVLNPVTEVKWPDPEVGRQWIREGESLVRALQAELGPSVPVVAGFYEYAPPD